MKFLETPAAFLAAVAFAIFTFGIGLTSPIWLMVSGRGPLEAVHAGTPIVATTIVGLIVTSLLAILANHLKKPSDSAPVAVQTSRTPQDGERRHRVVHIVVMMMFVVPFLTIVVGYLLKATIDFGAG